jgi:hypothetical protein
MYGLDYIFPTDKNFQGIRMRRRLDTIKDQGGKIPEVRFGAEKLIRSIKRYHKDLKKDNLLY